MGVIRNDLSFFDFLNATEGVAAGLFPWDLSKNATNYRVEDFEAQLRSALCDDPAGPVPVWLWQAGVLTPEALAAVPRGAEFVAVLKRYSRQGAAGGGRGDLPCAVAPAHGSGPVYVFGPKIRSAARRRLGSWSPTGPVPKAANLVPRNAARQAGGAGLLAHLSADGVQLRIGEGAVGVHLLKLAHDRAHRPLLWRQRLLVAVL